MDCSFLFFTYPFYIIPEVEHSIVHTPNFKSVMSWGFPPLIIALSMAFPSKIISLLKLNEQSHYFLPVTLMLLFVLGLAAVFHYQVGSDICADLNVKQ